MPDQEGRRRERVARNQFEEAQMEAEDRLGMTPVIHGVYHARSGADLSMAYDGLHRQLYVQESGFWLCATFVPRTSGLRARLAAAWDVLKGRGSALLW